MTSMMVDTEPSTITAESGVEIERVDRAEIPQRQSRRSPPAGEPFARNPSRILQTPV
jgi:hypothetical protein